MKQFLFGLGLLVAGLLCLHGARGQMPGTFTPIGIGTGGGVACTPNTDGGGSDGSVVGLWHFDNNGNDEAITKHNVSSLAGGAVYSTTQSKFGGYSLSIPTTATSFANIPAGIQITSDLTVEGWMWQTATATYTGMLGDDLTTAGVIANPAITIYAPGAASITATWSTVFGANAWHHAAWVRQAGTFKFYYDGVQQTGTAASTGTMGNGTTAWKLGRGYSGTYAMPSGSYLDEVRVSNVARYTANFTPPILPFCTPVPPTPQSAYRYWRLNISSSYGTTYARIAEWTMNAGGVNQIPAMTSNVTSGVTISSPGTQGGGFEEWRAADRVPSTDWYSGPSGVTWLKVDLGSAKHIDNYTIQAINGGPYGPAAWILQGSNDDSFYFNIDTQSGQTWTASQIRSYTPPSYP